MKNKNVSNIAYHIVCFVVLLNILQSGFGGLGIRFNMLYIEYILIAILFFIKGFKIKNYYNILLFIITVIIFLFNIFFNNSSTLSFYVEEFVLYALPLILLFLFEYDYKKLFKYLYKYCFCTLILYLINLLLDTNLLGDYMTFGYGGIFCATYILIYSILTENKKLFVFSIIAGLLIFAYGSRGSFLVFVLAVLLTFVFNINNKKKKALFLIIGLLFIFFSNNIMKFGVNVLTDMFGENLYAVRQLNNMINNESADKILGGRYYIYNQGIEEIKNNYIFGMGIGTFQEKYGYFVHNIFLDVYSTFGIIFGSFYFLFLTVLIKKVYTLSKKDDSIKIFFIFCLSLIVKLMLSKVFIYDPYIWLLISVFLNIICIYKKKVDI